MTARPTTACLERALLLVVGTRILSPRPGVRG